MRQGIEIKFYTLKSLVPEITGIHEDDVKLFDSTFKSVQRIEKKLRKISSFVGTHGIPVDKKDEFVGLMKDIYNDNNIKNVVYKFSDGKELNEEEGILLFDVLVKNIKDTELRERLNNDYRDEMRCKDLKDSVDEIIFSINEFVQMTDDFTYKARLEMVDVLKSQIKNILEINKKSLHETKKYFKTMDKIEGEIEKFAKDEIEKRNYPKSIQRGNKK